MKKSLFLWLLLIGSITLVWCQKSEPEVSQPEPENPENDVILTVEEPEEDEVDFVLPEWAKTSLTNEELDELAETNFPTGYSSSTYNTETEETSTEDYVYPEDFSHTLLIPEHATMASREVVSSGIEDGMIYTLTNVTLQDDTVISVLYIVDPVTLNFVAVNVENGNETRNYQFSY